MILCVICSEMCRAVRLSLRPGLRPQAGVAYHEPRLCENCLRADDPFLRNQIQRQLCRALSQCGAVLVYASEGHAQNRRILNVATTDNRTIFQSHYFWECGVPHRESPTSADCHEVFTTENTIGTRTQFEQRFHRVVPCYVTRFITVRSGRNIAIRD